MNTEYEPPPISRRTLLKGVGALGTYAALSRFTPAYARADVPNASAPRAFDGAIDLTIRAAPFSVNGRTGTAMTVNGTVPGPLLRLREGEEAVIRVHNTLDEFASIHWHGLIVPPDMDGVPGVSFSGIRPRSTFTYRFPVRQSGTYWYHSHSGGQEQLGLYAPIIIEPREPEPFAYDRDYVVQLSDWSFLNPEELLAKLKKQAGYFNLQRRTLGEFLDDVREHGFKAAKDERAMWGKMRMDPTDFADVTGVAYTYLINGLSREGNWTGLFNPGERVRLRFINSCAMTIMDVRIPGLKMTVVQADGQNVQPVEVDEFRFAPAETYDVIVEPQERAYTLFAENIGRSGYTRATLTPRAGLSAPVPPMRPRPLRTMADMGMEMSHEGGMNSMPGMNMGGMNHAGMNMGGANGTSQPATNGMSGMNHGATGMAGAAGTAGTAGTHTMPDGSTMRGPMKPNMPDMGRSEGMEMPGGRMHDMTGPTRQVGGLAIPGVRLLAPDGSHFMPPGAEMPGMTRAMQGMDMRGGDKPQKSGTPATPGHTMSGNMDGDVAGMNHNAHAGMNMGGADAGNASAVGANAGGANDGGMNHGGMNMGNMGGASLPPGMTMATPPGALDTKVYMHGPDSHGVGQSGLPMSVRNRMGEPGIGLEETGTKVLVYTDLKSLKPREDNRPPTREIELHITGNMERFMWSFNGEKYSQADSVRFFNGEKLRLILVNDTMMEHPIHLHGMWFEIENGGGEFRPRKHTVLVKPAERFPMLISADAPGRWAMHCHLLLHMEMGMFRVVEVVGGESTPSRDDGKSGDIPDIRENLSVNRIVSARMWDGSTNVGGANT